MNVVEPIRDKEIIDEIKEYLRSRNERDYILFLFGIHTGLRISDILSLKVKDVSGMHLVIREQKTNKPKRILLNTYLKRELNKFCKGKDGDEFLFLSRERTPRGKKKPIGRAMAYKILRDAGNEVGINAIGTHSLRKTFGYHFYQMNQDVALLMDIFNHSDASITLRYIGINQDTYDKAMNRFIL